MKAARGLLLLFQPVGRKNERRAPGAAGLCNCADTVLQSRFSSLHKVHLYRFM